MSKFQIRKGAPRKLQSQLFAYYLLLAFLILSAFSALFVSYVSQILIRREQNALQTLEDSMVNSVTKKLNDLDQISTNINYFNRKVDFLSAPSNEQSLSEYIISLNGTVMKADQINLYYEDGRLSEIGSITKNSTFTEDEVPWFESVYERDGWKLISSPYQTKRYSPNTQKKEWYVSLYRTAQNSKGQPIGVIETVKKCKTLFSDLSNYERKTDDPARILIFNETGELIYPYQASPEEYAPYETMIQNLLALTETSETTKDPVTGENCHYVLEHSSYSGWNYLILQTDRVILRPVYSMLKILLLVITGLLACSVLLSYLLARRMVLPVKHLKHIIQRVQLDTLGKESLMDYRVPYEELNELYVEFEKMNDSLKQSLNELDHARNLELKSRVTALQVQMNPHFYYNTLSCISILAENGQTEEVTKLCQTLSMIMRYITDTEDFIVSIQNEISYIEKYLYCMKIRYEDSLNYTISIPEELRQQSIPKLIIQPLVENAIKYGTNCLPPWHLSICGDWTSEGWSITVTDSGTGFSEQVLKDLHSRIHEIEQTRDPISGGLKIGGLGLINVYIRWKLYCKEGSFFDFGNTEDGHAFIKIGRKL